MPRVTPQVICLGEALIDLLAHEVGVPYEKVTSWQSELGGAPANVACGLARLGGAVAFVGCVGQDEAGKKLFDGLHQRGVDTRGLKVLPEATTRQIYVTRTAHGERQFVKFGAEKPDLPFADSLLTADHVPESLFVDADFLVLGTNALSSEESSRAVGRALKLAEKHFVRVVVDLNWRPMFWQDPGQALRLIPVLLRYADFLKVSLEEAQSVLRLNSPAAIVQAFNQLEGVIVTNGNKECRYYLGERQSRQAAFTVNPIDTTGAGDAFLAGFLHQLCQIPLQKLDDPVCAHGVIRYACATGALTTLGKGAIQSQPTHDQVMAFLAEHTGNISG
ncbi:MAG: carbohydrate kinase [Pseudanabaena sp. ELA607]